MLRINLITFPSKFMWLFCCIAEWANSIFSRIPICCYLTFRLLHSTTLSTLNSTVIIISIHKNIQHKNLNPSLKLKIIGCRSGVRYFVIGAFNNSTEISHHIQVGLTEESLKFAEERIKKKGKMLKMSFWVEFKSQLISN